MLMSIDPQGIASAHPLRCQQLRADLGKDLLSHQATLMPARPHISEPQADKGVLEITFVIDQQIDLVRRTYRLAFYQIKMNRPKQMRLLPYKLGTPLGIQSIYDKTHRSHDTLRAALHNVVGYTPGQAKVFCMNKDFHD